MRHLNLRRSTGRRGTGLLAVGLVGAALPGAQSAPAAAGRAPQGLVASTARPAEAFTAHSVQGRAVRAIHLGSRSGPVILVVGAIHGNEPAGIAVAQDLLADALHVRANLWVIADLNPDGVARGTRQNARGVDLNRNFPWHWRLAGRVGDFEYPGPHVLSEPESRFAFALIRRVHPLITIWFHQPLAVVDASGGSLSVEQRFASRVGLSVRQLQRYRGSAATWQNHRFPSSTDAKVEQYAHAVETAAH